MKWLITGAIVAAGFGTSWAVVDRVQKTEARIQASQTAEIAPPEPLPMTLPVNPLNDSENIKLIRQATDLTADCNNELPSRAKCDQAAKIDEVLLTRDICYGRIGQGEQEYDYHICAPDSIQKQSSESEDASSYSTVSKLIEEAKMFQETCSKYGRNDQSDDSCRMLDKIEKKLITQHICYGLKGESPNYQTYHVCGPNSMPIKIGIIGS